LSIVKTKKRRNKKEIFFIADQILFKNILKIKPKK